MSWCGEIRYRILRTRNLWRAVLVKACTDWADEGSQACSNWKDEGTSECQQWADEGSEQCCDWAPCSWFCDAYYWVANWVCQGWYWVADWVCQAWYWVAKWVCRAFAWLVYWVLTIVSWFVWIVLWIPCHVFGGPLGPDGPIQHVFVLVLENRSFDHMLGISTARDAEGLQAGRGIDAVSGVPTSIDGPSNQTNDHGGQTFKIKAGAPYWLPVDPPHEFCDVKLSLASTAIQGDPNDDTCSYSGVYPPITLAGFVDNYANKAAYEPDAALKAAAEADLGTVLACFTAAQVPAISSLAKEFAVCDSWFSSLPGPTWPNRFFLHAATSGGLDNSPGTGSVIASQLDGYNFSNGTIYDALDSKELNWRIYHGDAFPQVAALAGMDLATMVSNYHGLDDFAADLQNSDFDAAYTFIEPDYGHLFTHSGNFQCGNSQHPLDDVTRGDALIKYVYEAIRGSPHWESSLLVVTYDEHGGFYDHVAPPGATAPGDIEDPDNNKHGFLFDQLGVRVPAIVISPLIPALHPKGARDQNCNLIDHTRYDHGSLLATIEEIFGLSPLTNRDATANRFSHLLSLAVPRTDASLSLPAVADSGFNCNDDSANPPSGPSGPVGPADSDGSRPIPASLRGFVELAGIIDARLHPTDKVQIARRVREVQTVAAANSYLERVSAQLQAHRQRLRAAGISTETTRDRRRNRIAALRELARTRR